MQYIKILQEAFERFLSKTNCVTEKEQLLQSRNTHALTAHVYVSRKMWHFMILEPCSQSLKSLQFSVSFSRKRIHSN